MPALDELVPERPHLELVGRPMIIAHDVDHLRLDGRVAIGRKDGVMKSLRNGGFTACNQARANQHPIRPKHQGCRKASAISNSTGCHKQRLRRDTSQKVGHFRHKCEGCAVAAVASSLSTLRNDNVRTGVNGHPGMRY